MVGLFYVVGVSGGEKDVNVVEVVVRELCGVVVLVVKMVGMVLMRLGLLSDVEEENRVKLLIGRLLWLKLERLLMLIR